MSSNDDNIGALDSSKKKTLKLPKEVYTINFFAPKILANLNTCGKNFRYGFFGVSEFESEFNLLPKNRVQPVDKLIS